MTMSKQTFILAHSEARIRAIEAIKTAPDGYSVCVKEQTRSLTQNARLWALLTDVSNQVVWYGRKMSPEDWKHVFSAAWKKQDVVPGINGDLVVLGISTSKLSKSEMCDLQTLIEAFGGEHGVKWSA